MRRGRWDFVPREGSAAEGYQKRVLGGPGTFCGVSGEDGCGRRAEDIAIPVILVLLYLRRPYDRKSVPRDSLSMKGKAEFRRPCLELPSQASDELIRDEAADLSHAKTEDRPIE
jgi:hypothetical protein